jgi:hypothetical protein
MPPRQQVGYPDYQPDSYQLLRGVEFTALDKLIATYPAAATTAQPTITFHVRTPNVRMRTRVALVLVPVADTTIDTDSALNTTILDAGFPGSVWGANVQQLHENTRKSVPTMNVAGTKAAPVSIPTDAGLWGWEGQWETAGDDLLFRFVPPRAKAGNTVAAAWHVVVSYEAVQRLSAEEWQQMRQLYSLDTQAVVVLS